MHLTVVISHEYEISACKRQEVKGEKVNTSGGQLVGCMACREMFMISGL
jgi:hypothetical protein